jgi:hypothetical protein
MPGAAQIKCFQKCLLEASKLFSMSLCCNALLIQAMVSLHIVPTFAELQHVTMLNYFRSKQ